MDLTKILPNYKSSETATVVVEKETKPTQFEQLVFNFDEPEKSEMNLSAKQSLVLEHLSNNFANGATAKELSLHLYKQGLVILPERNSVQPRLNELTHLGLVKVVGKKTCDYTNRRVAIYKCK